MTLVDVVMAAAMLGIMASGIFGSFRYGFFTLQLLRENQRATQVILEKVETIRLYSWDQVVNTPGFIPTTFTDVYDPQGASGSQGATYSGTVSVAPCSLTPELRRQHARAHRDAELEHARYPPHAHHQDLYRQRRHPELCILELSGEQNGPGRWWK